MVAGRVAVSAGIGIGPGSACAWGDGNSPVPNSSHAVKHAQFRLFVYDIVDILFSTFETRWRSDRVVLAAETRRKRAMGAS